MKKILASIFLFSVSLTGFSQANKTAYVDVYYILNKSPEYSQAYLELEKRAKEWQTEIANKKEEIKKLKDALSIERSLLTQQLIDEKEEEISLVETELNNYQYEKFGTDDGDYSTQHKNIYKPILDQIHTITNDIAAKKRMDIVLVKSEQNTMIYANKRNDITELVLKEMERTRTRSKMTTKEIAALEVQDKIDESKEKQRTRRDLLRERQKDLESTNFNTSTTSEYNSEAQQEPTETAEEKRKRLNEEKIAEVKKKQQEVRDAQLKKIEEQKIAIKKKQEEIKIAREKAIKDTLDKKNNIQNANKSSNNNQLTDKQEAALAEREQKAKEAKAKRDKVIQERKQAMDKRKADAKLAQEKRINEAKEKRLKELQESKK